jgi:hypothetical protein
MLDFSAGGKAIGTSEIQLQRNLVGEVATRLLDWGQTNQIGVAHSIIQGGILRTGNPNLNARAEAGKGLT